MIDTDKYERMRLLFLDFIDTASDEVDEEAWKDKLTALDELLAEVKRLQKKVRKLNWVLTDLDEKIRNYESHVELMKAFEQGLELPETWKEMVE